MQNQEEQNRHSINSDAAGIVVARLHRQTTDKAFASAMQMKTIVNLPIRAPSWGKPHAIIRLAFTHRVHFLKESIMGILEELAGAAAAVVATKKLDPDASLITEGIAAFAGYKGVEAIEEHVEKSEEAKAEENTEADPQT